MKSLITVISVNIEVVTTIFAPLNTVILDLMEISSRKKIIKKGITYYLIKS